LSAPILPTSYQTSELPSQVNCEKSDNAKRQVAATDENQINLRRHLTSAHADENNSNPKGEARNQTESEEVATVEYRRDNRGSIRRSGGDCITHDVQSGLTFILSDKIVA
jgi:hypothetical protein